MLVSVDLLHNVPLHFIGISLRFTSAATPTDLLTAIWVPAQSSKILLPKWLKVEGTRFLIY